MRKRTTEGDVETNVVWPFLTGYEYLSIPREQIASKKYIPTRDIGKGASFVKGFAPDFLVYANRVPVLVLESKAPDEPAELAYAQARLYAAEVNSSYRSGLNPISFVIGTNGTTLLFGPADAQPTVDWNLAGEVKPGPEALDILRNAGWPALQALGGTFSNLLERQRYFSASYIFGGQARLNRRLGQNSLSDVLSPVIRRYFDTESPEEKDEILEKAYVDSDVNTRYARTFETFLRDKTIPIHAPSVRQIAPHKKDEKHFTDALSHYSSSLPATGSIQLLIGAVGAGKSTFIERFERFLLPDNLKSQIFWVYANFNEAPSNPNLYEKWLCERFVAEFRRRYYSDDPSIQLSVFADKKRDFDFANYLIKDADIHEYNRRLSIELSDWNRDPWIFATSAARYLIGDKRVGVVVVLDNTDRGTREQQLRLFEVAEWFKSETRSCCVVALRDETYERYKSQPPLDAFIHANHFYIRAPRFIDIVRKRLQLSLASLDSGPIKTSISGLGDVVIPVSRVSDFLDTIYRHLFASTTRKISWITEGLSGKSARSALRMFARLIYSPHIDERHFIRVAAAAPNGTGRNPGSGTGPATVQIPEKAILNALMKTDYMYFSDDHGFVFNVIDFSDGTTTSDNFLRVEILQFLVSRRKMAGDVGMEGYFLASSLCQHLGLMGYDPRDVLTELNWCDKHNLLVTERSGDRDLVETDIVKAHASAYVHIGLLMDRIEYLANCMLTTKVFDQHLANRVADIWNVLGPDFDISLDKKRELLRRLKEYVAYWSKRRDSLFPMSAQIGEAPAIILQGIERSIERAENIQPPLPLERRRR